MAAGWAAILVFIAVAGISILFNHDNTHGTGASTTVQSLEDTLKHLRSLEEQNRQTAAVADQSTPKAPGIVSIGERGQFTSTSIGCPTLDEFNQLGADQVSHDRVGFNRHFAAYDCITVRSGDTGLNLDYSLLSGANKIRLDRDEKIYWIYTQNQEKGTWLWNPITASQNDTAPTSNDSTTNQLPICNHCGNEECWGDESRQDISCRNLTDNLLLSMRNATRGQVQREMKVKGREIENGLHFISNYSRGTRWGSGDVNFYFDGHGKVDSIDVSFNSPDLSGEYDFVWNRTSLPAGCSDLPNSRLAHCDHTQSLQRLLRGVMGHD